MSTEQSVKITERVSIAIPIIEGLKSILVFLLLFISWSNSPVPHLISGTEKDSCEK